MLGVSIYILLNFTIPMLSSLLEEFGSDLPPLTRTIAAISGFANAFGLYVLIIIALAGATLFMVRKRPDGKLATHRASLRVPVLGG